MFVTRSDGLVCRVFIVFIFLHTSELPSACDGKCQKHFPSILGKVSDFSVGIPRIFIRSLRSHRRKCIAFPRFLRKSLWLFLRSYGILKKIPKILGICKSKFRKIALFRRIMKMRGTGFEPANHFWNRSPGIKDSLHFYPC